jgi:hypothetical protein
MTTERYWIDHCIGIARDAGNLDAAKDATKELEALRSALTDAQEIARRGDEIILKLDAKLAQAQSSLTASEKRVQELEPAAECWNALCSCDRIKIMGVAGLDSNSPDFATPRAHIGLELWTQHEAKGDAQDINGRDWFSRFMEKAVAAYRASGRTP